MKTFEEYQALAAKVPVSLATHSLAQLQERKERLDTDQR